MTIKARVLSKFPAQVLGGSAITITRVGGVYTIAVDLSSTAAIESVAEADLDNLFVFTYRDNGSPTYGRIALDDLASIITANLDDTLVSIAALTPTANQGIYFSDTDVAAAYSLTAGGRALGGVTAAADKIPYFTSSSAADVADFTAYGRSIVAVASEAALKALVNLEIGTDVQAYDAELTAIAALAVTDGNIIVGNGTTWVAESGATARTSLGVGTGDSPQFTGIELGHATDTTLTRVSAGIAAIEGVNIVLVSGAQTLTDKVLTAPDINGGTADALTSLGIRSTGTGAFDLQLVNTENLTGNRALTVTLGDAARTLSLAANLTVNSATTISAFGASILDDADEATFKATVNLEIGTDVQAWDSDLDAIAALTTTAAGRSVLAIADPGVDRVVAWDDTAGAMAAIALADITAEAAPASGDFILIYGAEGDLRKVDWADLPGAAGGISDIVEDTTPQLGGDLDANTFNIGFDDATGIEDDSGNEQLIFQKTASAINHVEVTNASVGTGPTIGAAGDDTNIDLLIVGKGTGKVKVDGKYPLGQGRHTAWIPAAAMFSRTTNGAASGAAEMATNKNMFLTKDFDTTTQEFIQFEIQFPKSWNLGTVTFQPVWSHPSTTTNFGVVFGMAGVARSNDDVGDVAFGTAVTSTDTGGTTNDIYIGPESAAITIAGTPAADDVVQFQINRTVADGGDTMAVDARLHGIRLFYTLNAADDT